MSLIVNSVHLFLSAPLWSSPGPQRLSYSSLALAGLCTLSSFLDPMHDCWLACLVGIASMPVSFVLGWLNQCLPLHRQEAMADGFE